MRLALFTTLPAPHQLSLKLALLKRAGSGWCSELEIACGSCYLLSALNSSPQRPHPTLSSPIYNAVQQAAGRGCRVPPLNRICVAGAGNHLTKIAAHLDTVRSSVTCSAPIHSAQKPPLQRSQQCTLLLESCVQQKLHTLLA